MQFSNLDQWVSAQPYPGLRPFELHEALLFFGRESHTEELLARLSRNRFLAVVGSSGGGKSSLVRAGLVPSLYRGFLIGTTSRWKVATMRPAGAPLDSLASSLKTALSIEESPDKIREKLMSTSFGFIELVRECELPSNESLLLVIDQFEELFRYQLGREDFINDASCFVRLILNAVEQADIPIYVVITMRSDYLGDCAQFPGLPEALNQSQYLIPRLTREQRREAIENPLRLAGASFTPRLVQRILNESGDNPDQLPIMQHALLQTYKRWQEEGSSGPIDFGHYALSGGIEMALNNHAELLYTSFESDEQRLIDRLFRCLTTTQGSRMVRRPTPFQKLCAIAGNSSNDTMEKIIDTFADPQNSLLILSSAELEPDTVVDISHESLIRNWIRLGKLVKEEAKSGAWYRDLARDVLRHESGEVGLYFDPELQKLQERRRQEQWNAEWAAQYWPGNERPSFHEVLHFLQRSDTNQQEELHQEEVRRKKELKDAKIKLYLVGLVLFLVVAGVILVRSLNRSYEEKARTASNELARYQHEITRLQNNSDFLHRQLLTTTDVEERERLKMKIDALQKQYEDQQTEANNAISTLKEYQQSQILKRTDEANLVKNLQDLNNRLASATEERDRARKQLLEMDRRIVPTILILPQYSVITPRTGPLAGEIAIMIGGINRAMQSEDHFWIKLQQTKEPLPERFQDDEARALSLLRSMDRMGCTSFPERGLWCFKVHKAKTVSETEYLGHFAVGNDYYNVVATGWQQNAIGETDVLSLVIYAARQPDLTESQFIKK